MRSQRYAANAFQFDLLLNSCSSERRLLQHALRNEGDVRLLSLMLSILLTPSLEHQSKLAWDDPRSNRGFVQKGRERVTQSKDANEIAKLREKAPDFKETMEIGRDWDTVWQNKWPAESDCPGFKDSMLKFFQVRYM